MDEQEQASKLATAVAAEVALTEDDIPGAALGARQPEELKVPELKHWLACRGASRTGLKAQLVQRVKEYMQSGLSKCVIDPDNGANLDVKRRRLGLVPGSSSLPPLAPTDGWAPGLVGIPDLKFCQVYNYLVVSKAITGDGAEMGAMKSLKAVKYFKEDYVQDLKINTRHSHYAYVQSQTQASMKRILYRVEICMEKPTADIIAARCNCPAGEWPSAACSHVAATLFAVEDYVAHKDQQSCTSRLQQWHQPAVRPNLPTPISQATFKKVTGKFDEKQTRERVVRPTTTYYDPRRPADRGLIFERLQEFKANLARANFQCGWLLQLTPATIETLAQEDQVQFPLTKLALNSACSKVLEMFSNDAVTDLEKQTRGQSSCTLWHQSHAGRITASNFGRVCKCTWFKHRDISRIQSLLKDLITPTRFNHPPAPIKWGVDCEPKAAACYVEVQGAHGNGDIEIHECGLFLHPLHKFKGATPDRLVTDPNSFPPEGLLEIKCPWKFRDCTITDACRDSSFCCELQSSTAHLKTTHVYYYQVQGQLAITGRSWCDFVVYTTKDIHVERIFFDSNFWSSVEVRLTEFYLTCLLPQFVHSKGIDGLKSLL